MSSDTDGMLTRQQLQNNLVRAAMIRSLLSLGSMLPCMLLWGALPAAAQNGVTSIVAIFGGPLLVSWIVTKTLCRRLVRCPRCSGSLWETGNGRFKPRRMQLRPKVTGCPHCGTEFSAAG